MKLLDLRCVPPKENHTNYYHITFDYNLNDLKNIGVLKNWCVENFGDGPGPFYIVSERDPSVLYRWVDDLLWGEIHFSNEADASLFVLRWS